MPSVKQPVQPSTKPVEAPVASEPDSPPSNETSVPIQPDSSPSNETAVPIQPAASDGSSGPGQVIPLLTSLALLVLSFALAL